MPESLTKETLATVIDGAIPIKKSPAAAEPEMTESDANVEESTTRRTHRQRMKAFLQAAKSVA